MFQCRFLGFMQIGQQTPGRAQCGVAVIVKTKAGKIQNAVMFPDTFHRMMLIEPQLGLAVSVSLMMSHKCSTHGGT